MLLIDGHSQIHRAYHANMHELTSSDGEPTKATYVFMRWLFSSVRRLDPTYLAMAVDVPRGTLRRSAAYPAYKANRAEPEPDFHVQRKRIVQVVKMLGVPVVHAPRWEADDVIATLVAKARTRRVDVTIVSRDKDLYQLLRPGVCMYDPTLEQHITHDDVPTRLGCTAAQVVDYLAMVGDSSDNLTGVPGMGPVAARKVLEVCGSLKVAMQGNPLLAARTNKLLHEHRDTLALMRELVTLQVGLPLKYTNSNLRWRGFDTKEVRPLFRQLGFKRWSQWGAA